MLSASITTAFLLVALKFFPSVGAGSAIHGDATTDSSAVRNYFGPGALSLLPDFAANTDEEERCPCTTDQLRERERYRRNVYNNCKRLSEYVMEAYAKNMWSAADGFPMPAMNDDPYKCNSLLSGKAKPEMCECQTDTKELNERLKLFRTCMQRPRWLASPLGGFYKAPDCSQHLHPKDFQALSNKEKSWIQRNSPQFYEQTIAKRGAKMSLGF